jgi:hypothetical protein
MKKMQEKSKRYKYTRWNTNSPSHQAIGMANTKFETQEGSNQNTGFLNGKNHTPPEAENTRFYQISLDKPQDKPRPLNRHNRKKVDHQETHLKAGVEPSN